MDIPRPHQTFESCSNIAIIVILDKIKLKFLTCAIFICNKCCAHIAYTGHWKGLMTALMLAVSPATGISKA
jgi:hypothetical protein